MKKGSQRPLEACLSGAQLLAETRDREMSVKGFVSKRTIGGMHLTIRQGVLLGLHQTWIHLDQHLPHQLRGFRNQGGVHDLVAHALFAPDQKLITGDLEIPLWTFRQQCLVGIIVSEPARFVLTPAFTEVALQEQGLPKLNMGVGMLAILAENLPEQGDGHIQVAMFNHGIDDMQAPLGIVGIQSLRLLERGDGFLMRPEASQGNSQIGAHFLGKWIKSQSLSQKRIASSSFPPIRQMLPRWLNVLKASRATLSSSRWILSASLSRPAASISRPDVPFRCATVNS